MIVHGTTSGYRGGCRCSACKVATSKAGHTYREKYRTVLLERRNAYRDRHREELRAKQALYATTHREECNAYQKKYAATHKETVAAYKHQYSEDHHEELSAIAKTYSKEHSAERVAYQIRYSELYPEKVFARAVLSAAVKFGFLTRPLTCKNIAASEHRGRIEAHHPDYDYPLDVEWLCVKCHRRRHAELRAATKG